ncbi:MarR family winged helix-turn-helix transcriptional regulator [Streptoalloteichus hindustanus]|uniref:DNA-binding transcriptional regulator, MarR family n=1 Tax=Streptoalloteichus hindustanus TaxID=2017 RepID=A0A1M5J3G7_STRHI|nr:MarR family transcriptional regulator [Streptoalloteichus hindustanus]SHG35147.1 DNA-binding transcriptional regulator, MarR family [Streptoalloteichus hindustanus]
MASRTTGGDAVTELVEEVFTLNGLFLRAGDTMTAPHGLTSARWQVLGVLNHGPATVAQIARLRGLRRQSVQQTVDRLRDDELVTTRPNPKDRRAPLVHMTEKGARALRALAAPQAAWADELAAAVPPDDLATALAALRALRARLESD